MLSRDENLLLQEKKVVVVGCGGLGGHIIDQLARLGIGHITAIDGDVFDQTNLNRQLLSHSRNIGKSKSLAARDHIKLVNPLTTVISAETFLNENNAVQLLKEHDVICDALDNMQTRKITVKTAQKLGIPLVYGAIAGWYGQVTTIFPDCRLPGFLLNEHNKGIEQQLGNPSFTPAIVAGLQVAEVVKIITGKGDLLKNKFLMINTLENEFETFDF